MAGQFKHMHSVEAKTPDGIWGWAKRLVDDMNRLGRLWDLANMDLTGKGGQTVKVKADETGFELVP